MKLSVLIFTWPVLLTFNALLLSLVFYFTLGVSIEVFSGIETKVTFSESVAVSLTLMAIRGAFSLRLHSEG